MDPNTALAEILRGNLIDDHVEALRQWLGNGGFQPNLETPDDTLHWFQVKLRHYDTPAQLPEEEAVRVSANTTGILVLRARNWVPFLTWFQVLHAPRVYSPKMLLVDDSETIEEL
jgi:hypothetical protein